MRQAADTIGFLLAAAVVAAVMVSAIKTVVLPRATNSRVSRWTSESLRVAFRLRTARLREFDDRDRTLAMFAPIALVTLLVAWLFIIFAAYAVMIFCVSGRSLAQSLQVSGSSIVTLGTTPAGRFWPSILSYSEAAVGLLLVALFISYFPSIYGAFTRREAGVTLLEVRAGSPPQPTTMLIRYHRIEGRLQQLTELWRTWEVWFADIEESHTTFPILVHFRSPQADRSWITAAGALLDGAAMWVACVDHPMDPDAQLTLRAGFLALRRIADGFRIPYEQDPAPDGPISVDREEWDHAIDTLAAAGVPVVADRDQAWRDWRGWRVNYDTVLLALARVTEAPPVPWVSDRSPIPASRLPARRSNGWRRSPRR